jgi:hypothetical protein
MDSFLDLLVYVTVISGSIIRLLNQDDTTQSRCILAISTLAIWSKVVLLFGVFEQTSALIAMVLHIIYDIRYLVLLLFISIWAYSRALWIICFPDSESNFSNIKGGLLEGFQFMMGGYDPFQFKDSYQEDLAIFLSVMMMVTISILLLNLLIALMGSTFGRVEQHSIAEWYLLKAQTILKQVKTLSKGYNSGPVKIFSHQFTSDYIKNKKKAGKNSLKKLLELIDEKISEL